MATILTGENVVAADVTFEQFMDGYAEDFCEWVAGMVIKMSPVTDKHDALTRYLSNVLEAYLSLRPIAVLREAPFVMKATDTSPAREPDLQVILNHQAEQVKETRVDGAADLVIEVVSLESTERDYGVKFKEYEEVGVTEYWIIDPIRKEAKFYLRNAEGRYNSQPVSIDGQYKCTVLPDLQLNVPTLWAKYLPNLIAIAESMKARFSE